MPRTLDHAEIGGLTANVIVFGQTFIANTDLSELLRQGFPLNRSDRATFQGGDVLGDTDCRPFRHAA